MMSNFDMALVYPIDTSSFEDMHNSFLESDNLYGIDISVAFHKKNVEDEQLVLLIALQPEDGEVV